MGNSPTPVFSAQGDGPGPASGARPRDGGAQGRGVDGVRGPFNGLLLGSIYSFPPNTKPSHPLIRKPPLSYILVLYWRD